VSILLAIIRSVGRVLAALESLSRQLVRSDEKLDRQLLAIDEKLDRILALLEPAPASAFVFTATLENQITEGVTMLELSDSQRATLTIKPVDKKGKPALLDGAVTWATSDGTVCSVTPGMLDANGDVVQDPSGLSAVLEGIAPGSGRVTVTGDAAIGETVKPITGVLDITVVAGEAISVEIEAGAPVEV
jgi:hypothetical protein